MEKLSKLAAAAAIAAGMMAAPTITQAEQTTPGGSARSTPCFFVSQWETWSVLDDNTILMRVNHRDIYKAGVTGGANQLKSPGAFLLSESHGNTMCSHLDLQFSVADQTIHSFRTPLIARSLVKLTPEEIAAIPKKDLPAR